MVLGYAHAHVHVHTHAHVHMHAHLINAAVLLIGAVACLCIACHASAVHTCHTSGSYYYNHL
jgi:hypothetical protein